jgi:hypothetical protein
MGILILAFLPVVIKLRLQMAALSGKRMCPLA